MRALKKLLDLQGNKQIQKYLRKLNPTAATNYSLWEATKD